MLTWELTPKLNSCIIPSVPNFKINTPIFCCPLFSENYLNPQAKPVYSTMVVEEFQIYGVEITGKYICESKNRICSFLPMPPNKTLPQVFIISPQADRNYPFLVSRLFWRSIFPQQKGGEEYGVEKITKIKPARVLVTIFDEFHHLCNLYILAFCFVVP